jgi:Uma2 family endonuclease
MTDTAGMRWMTAAEYLAWERDQVDKHEYHLGEVFAMAGGSPRHNFLGSAVVSELRNALRPKGCHVLSSDQRIAASQGRHYVYADAVAVCGPVELEPGTDDVLANPGVVVEVLSPRTEKYDRGAKWNGYQRLSSLTDYLLVSQTAVRIEHYQREPDGSWRYRLLEEGSTVTLSNGATLAVDAIYDGAFALLVD